MKDKGQIRFGSRACSGCKGFTIVELLVIIGIVAVLAMIQFSAVAGAKSHSKVAMCASNARQIALALHLFASDNSGKLPASTGGGWAWDLVSSAANAIIPYGLQKRNFYCPGTEPRFTDYENFADPLSISTPSRTLWTFGMPAGGNDGAPGFHIVGYVLALSQFQILTSNRNTTILAEPVQSGGSYFAPPPNVERVLLADAIISAQAPAPGTYTAAQKPSYNYSDIGGGFYKHHTSPHLNGTVPAGGNVAFKDGHVAWRKFEDMDQRANGPGFWW